MNAKRRAASLLLGVLLAACAGTPATPTPAGSSPPAPSPTPITTPGPTATSSVAAVAAASPPPSPPDAAPTPSADRPQPGADRRPDARVVRDAAEVYVVVAGDTLWEIAQRYGVTVDVAAGGQPADHRPPPHPPGRRITIPPGHRPRRRSDGYPSTRLRTSTTAARSSVRCRRRRRATGTPSSGRTA